MTDMAVNLPNDFTLIINPNDMKDDVSVKRFLNLLKHNHLEEWKFGERGDYISSYFITNGLKLDTMDTLTSPIKNDKNYSMLLKMHLQRALSLLTNN